MLHDMRGRDMEGVEEKDREKKARLNVPSRDNQSFVLYLRNLPLSLRQLHLPIKHDLPSSPSLRRKLESNRLSLHDHVRGGKHRMERDEGFVLVRGSDRKAGVGKAAGGRREDAWGEREKRRGKVSEGSICREGTVLCGSSTGFSWLNLLPQVSRLLPTQG